MKCTVGGRLPPSEDLISVALKGMDPETYTFPKQQLRLSGRGMVFFSGEIPAFFKNRPGDNYFKRIKLHIPEKMDKILSDVKCRPESLKN